jgi:hypothetical protein
MSTIRGDEDLVGRQRDRTNDLAARIETDRRPFHRRVGHGAQCHPSGLIAADEHVCDEPSEWRHST